MNDLNIGDWVVLRDGMGLPMMVYDMLGDEIGCILPGRKESVHSEWYHASELIRKVRAPRKDLHGRAR